MRGFVVLKSTFYNMEINVLNMNIYLIGTICTAESKRNFAFVEEITKCSYLYILEELHFWSM